MPDLKCHSRFATGTKSKPESSVFATEVRKNYVFITEALAVICENLEVLCLLKLFKTLKIVYAKPPGIYLHCQTKMGFCCVHHLVT